MITNETTTMAASNSSSSRMPKKTVKDFKFIKEIGNGSYSTVRRKRKRVFSKVQSFAFLFI
jgi:hypothetical protein